MHLPGIVARIFAVPIQAVTNPARATWHQRHLPDRPDSHPNAVHMPARLLRAARTGTPNRPKFTSTEPRILEHYLRLGSVPEILDSCPGSALTSFRLVGMRTWSLFCSRANCRHTGWTAPAVMGEGTAISLTVMARMPTS